LEAIKIANHHPRVKILNPGPGVGGHCISVDPWFFVEAAPDLTELISAARRVNDRQPHFVFDLIKHTLGDELSGKHIAALGLAFKPDVDDLRESPAVEVATLLVQAGAIVRGYEPFKKDASIPGIKMAHRIEDAIKDADLLLLLVGHQELKTLDPGRLREITPARIAVDTVGGWDTQSWFDAGFKHVRLGVGNPS
jgi:UDP-N-acetyl-D-mannosaminuronic acid dehydrogenase